ncbi:MAG: hypothetical protein Q9209_002696 [Squamulea sp. 1 TL-2023]
MSANVGAVSYYSLAVNAVTAANRIFKRDRRPEIWGNGRHLRRSHPIFSLNFSSGIISLNADAAAQVASSHSLASLHPPSYDDLTSPAVVSARKTFPPPAVHPRVAVLLGVSRPWHVPLLVARALSTAPAMWWGLRCALTFLGDLLLSDGMGDPGNQWTVEKRFRVTEVFLAILWVCWSESFTVVPMNESNPNRSV